MIIVNGLIIEVWNQRFKLTNHVFFVRIIASDIIQNTFRREGVNTRRLPEELNIDLLDRSTHKIYQITAVIFDRHGVIFSWGWNHHSQHAEEHAISRANRSRLPGATIQLLGRKKESGNVLLSKPCADCERIILKNGITRVIYSEYDPRTPKTPIWKTLIAKLT